MHQTLENTIDTKSSRGGRVNSPKLRASLELSNDFEGLDQDVNRYDLLLLAKRVGKVAGFSPRMIQLLDYYMSFTRNIDWEEGSNPIVYQALTQTALDLGLSERQTQRLENDLFKVGAITWNDSSNHRRYGRRCPETGMILFAYGVDLTPLALLKPDLEARLHEKQLYDQSWMESKRQISWYRRQIKANLAEMTEGEGPQPEIYEFTIQYEAIAMQIRTHMDLQSLRSLLEGHKELHTTILSYVKANMPQSTEKQIVKTGITEVETRKMSPLNDQNVTHYKYTNNLQSNKLDTCSAPTSSELISYQESPGSTPGENKDRTEQTDSSQSSEERSPAILSGLQHITHKQALNAASERFRAHIPMEPRPMNWNDLVEAAYKLKSELDISQQSWANACVTLSRSGAAICLLLTDQAALREKDPVRNPAAYFNAMIGRSKTGKLNLQNSIFAILKRDSAVF